MEKAKEKHMSSLEKFWIDLQRIAGVAKRRLCNVAPEETYEKVFWIGYNQAIRDMSSVLTLQIAADLIRETAPEPKEPHGAAPVLADADLFQVQKLPHQKTG